VPGTPLLAEEVLRIVLRGLGSAFLWGEDWVAVVEELGEHEGSA
jgi:hypothetical protein